MAHFRRAEIAHLSHRTLILRVGMTAGVTDEQSRRLGSPSPLHSWLLAGNTGE
jgi:hypothetical protein